MEPGSTCAATTPPEPPYGMTKAFLAFFFFPVASKKTFCCFSSSSLATFRKSAASALVTAASAAWLASYGASVAPAGGSTTCETIAKARDGRSSSFVFADRSRRFRENASDASSRAAWTMAGRNCLTTFPTPFTSFSSRLQSAGSVRHAANRSRSADASVSSSPLFSPLFFFSPLAASAPLAASPYALSHLRGMHPTFAMTTSGVPCVKRTRSRQRATSASSPRSTRETSHCNASHSCQCWLRSDATRSALGVAAATVRRQSGYASSDASNALPTPWPASARTTVLEQALTRPPGRSREEANAREAVSFDTNPSPKGTNEDAKREERVQAWTSSEARAARRSDGRDMRRGVRRGVRGSLVGRDDAETLVVSVVRPKIDVRGE